MISQLFILAPNGHTIVHKDYRGEVPKEASETFLGMMVEPLSRTPHNFRGHFFRPGGHACFAPRDRCRQVSFSLQPLSFSAAQRRARRAAPEENSGVALRPAYSAVLVTVGKLVVTARCPRVCTRRRRSALCNVALWALMVL